MTAADLSNLEYEEIWTLWIENHDQLVKDELVVRYLSLVENVAGRLKIGLPQSVEISELVNAGIIGLISAIDNFEPDRGFRFETYAVPRIRGSILDSLRDYDWMPRSIRTKSKALEQALVKLEGKLGRAPFDEEVASELDLDLDSYFTMLEEVKITSILSLDQTYLTSDGETSSLAQMIEDFDAENITESMEWNEAKEITKNLIKGLSQQERLVIALYYYEELTLKEIGQVLNISESRVSQIHSKVILNLKAQLKSKIFKV